MFRLLIISCIFFFACKTNPFPKKYYKEFWEFKENANSININDTIITDTFDLKICDSIETKVIKFQHRIQTQNNFSLSNTKVNITYFENQSDLNYIQIKEESRKFQDTDKFIEYIVENDSIVKNHNYYGYQLGLTIDFNKNYLEQVGLNTFLNDAFYRTFSLILYKEIKVTQE